VYVKEKANSQCLWQLNSCRIIVSRILGKRMFGRPRRLWKVNDNLDLREKDFLE
jgi:hypothetical protein